MNISVLRLGHRCVRDDRITTHAALVSRAFGCNKIYMTEVDDSILKTIEDVNERWGHGIPNFKIEIIKNWKNIIKKYKNENSCIIHLTMYGINITDFNFSKIIDDKNNKDILIVIGAEKVPREIYDLADYNIAIGNQPHSEIASLAVILDRLLLGSQFNLIFNGRLKIIPTDHGKIVKELN